MITQEKIQITTEAISEINSLIHSNKYNTENCFKVLKRHKQDFGLMKRCIDAGIFIRVARGKYKSTLLKIEPIHGRRVLEKYYKKWTDKPQEIEKPAKVKKSRQKSLSLFWGLIKFTR